MKKRYIRKKCVRSGCNRLGRNKGLYKGRTRYDKYCQYHHKGLVKLGLFKDYFSKRNSIDNSVCESCGWDKAPCDRHRIDSKIGYEPENVVILCPNCHRMLEHE